MSVHHPADFSLWTGRLENNSQRFFQRVVRPRAADPGAAAGSGVDETQLDELGSSAFVSLLGYAVDEGVRRNMGRPGAADGPDVIRKCLAGLAVHRDYGVADHGNVSCESIGLEEVQDHVAQWVSGRRDAGEVTLLLGGGHDMAFAHGLGHLRHMHDRRPDSRLLIVNFDAHFDLRDQVAEGGHSGSPFRQLLEWSVAHRCACTYLALGIQSSANHAALFERAQQCHVLWQSADELNRNALCGRNSLPLQQALEQSDFVYLSVCLDVFQQSLAPGVSAPQALGLNLPAFLPLFDQVLSSGKVIGLDLAELNPVFDRDFQTARLAAALILRALESGFGAAGKGGSAKPRDSSRRERPC